jgi:hypothetical protein
MRELHFSCPVPDSGKIEHELKRASGMSFLFIAHVVKTLLFWMAQYNTTYSAVKHYRFTFVLWVLKEHSWIYIQGGPSVTGRRKLFLIFLLVNHDIGLTFIRIKLGDRSERCIIWTISGCTSLFKNE